jgi:osmoprotectant transport system ATP-binding protein
MIFQESSIFPWMRVRDNVAYGLDMRRVDAATRRRVVDHFLELTGLAPFADAFPHQLSGGMRQRAAIARALMLEPDVLLMDEPFGALDPVTRDQLGTAVRALHDRLGLTTIIVTHDMAEALILADRVLVMDAGRIVADATPQALLAGQGGAVADALVAVPREQARRLRALEEGA